MNGTKTFPLQYPADTSTEKMFQKLGKRFIYLQTIKKEEETNARITEASQLLEDCTERPKLKNKWANRRSIVD